MKKLIFIDNDVAERSATDVENYITPTLEMYGGLDKDYASNIEIISDLYKKNKDELYDLFFSGKNAILSWSVYTSTYFSNSRNQLLHFLRVAGTSKIKNIVYLDISGMVEGALSKLQYDDTKGLFAILTAIELNYIVTLKDKKFIRLRLDLASEGMFKYEEVVLSELLEINIVD